MIMEDKFSNIWSTYIQRPETLYKTREIRFRDENKQQYLQALEFKDGMNILDIGCGTGAYCHALERWLPNSKITGIDRDSAFIEYAIEKSKQINSKCSFIIGDAINLEFPDKSFDATTSHTVVEHVEINKFLSEQFRVLKDGGVITVLSVRTSLSSTPESSQIQSEEEKDLWDRVEPYFKSSDQKYGVAKHSINETDLATRMTNSGFHDISIHFIVQTNIPDNSDVSPALAKAIIEANRQVELDGIVLAQTLAPEVMIDADIKRFKKLINSRFDNRIRMYETGQKFWDVSASVLAIVRGYK